MRLDSFNNVSGVKNVAKKIASVNRVNEFSKPAPRSVRDEVIARRKKQKDDYKGEYSPVVSGDRCKAYIVFTNSLDYYKTIYTNEFIAK